MGKSKYLLLAPVLAALLTAQATAQTLQFEFAFEPESLSVRNQAGYDHLLLKDGMLPFDTIPGHPWLPAKTVNVLLPDGAISATCSASADEELILTGINVFPAQPLHPMSMPAPAFTPPDPAVYGSAEIVPGAMAVEQGPIQRMRGRLFLTVRLNPVRYAPALGNVYLARRITLTVQCAAKPLSNATSDGGTVFTPRQSDLFDNMLRNMVVNPQDIEQNNDQQASQPLDGENQTQQPMETVPYLLITTEVLSNSFQQLATHRETHDAIATRVLTVEHIQNNYDGKRPDGFTDTQTKIRNCIIDYVNNFGTEYVVFGGDETIVPVRYCPVTNGEYSAIMPTDLYYAGLDGTWDDSNTNGIYGEYGPPVSPPEGDMAYDVLVARIPVRTSTQADYYIDKLKNFENSGDPYGFGRRVFISGYEAFTNYVGPNRPTDLIDDGYSEFQEHDPVSDMEINGRRMWRDYINQYDRSTVTRYFFDTLTSWDTAMPGDFFQNGANMVMKMSDGYNFCSFSGHGGSSGWPLENGTFDTGEASALVALTAFVYTPSCMTAGFDLREPCLSEAFLRNPNGGALGYVGCSHFGWSGISFAYQDIFFEEIYRYRRSNLGEAFLRHKTRMGPGFRWLHYGLNLQGDPLAIFMRPGLPDTPIHVSASDGLFSDRVQVTWNAASNAASYSVWRDTSTNLSSAAQRADGITGTNYDDTSAAAGILYHYWVRSTNDVGPSEFSAPDSGYVSLPSATGVSASDGLYSDRIRVSWNPVANATYYKIYRGTNSSFLSASEIAQSPTAAHDDSSAQPMQLYYYWVQAFNSQFAYNMSLSDFGHRALAAPTGVSASRATYTELVRVAWNACAGADSYQVFRSSVNDSQTSAFLGETAAPVYEDFSATPGAEWFYWIKAVGSLTPQLRMASPFSQNASGWKKLAAPSNVQASDGTYGDKVRIAWTAVTGATSYDIYRALTTNPADSLVMATGVAAASYDDTSAVVGRTYYYWIKANSAVSVSALAGGDAGWRGAASTLPAPTGVSASQGTLYGKIRVTWNLVSGATAYEVWRSPAADTNVTALVEETVGARFDDLNIQTGLAYTYRVRAKNSAGPGLFSESAWGYGSDEPTPPGAEAAVFNDYDGDGVSDLAVYNASTGAWHIRSLAGTILLSGGAWGGPGLIPAPGDYTGNGVYDIAVYDTRSGAWFAMDINGTTVLMNEIWGGTGMTPAWGDYSGNGIYDLAVYAPVGGSWFIRTVFGSLVAWGMPFGSSGMVPAPGDYDGDGISDFALYEQTSGTWYIMSAGGVVLAWAEPWGGPAFVSVPGDYNGDGIGDLAVYDILSGQWFIRTIGNNLIVWGAPWGGYGLRPAPGDYNGDGISDLAVYSQADGMWFIASPNGSVLAWGAAWGGPGLEPVGQR